MRNNSNIITITKSIPEEWELKKLGELAKIQRGASPRPIDSPIWYDHSSKIGWVRISDVTSSKGKYLCKTTDYFSEIGVSKSRFLPTGNLLVSICASVGLPIITKIDTCYHDGFVSITKLQNVDREFLYYKLNQIRHTLRDKGQTGSQSNLNTSIVRNIEIALPPLEEQRAIAEVLSDIDALIEAQEALIEKKRLIKQGVMQELLTSKRSLPGFSGNWKKHSIGQLFKISAGGDLVKKAYSKTENEIYKYPIFSNSLSNQGLYGFSNFYEYEGNSVTITARGTLGVAFYRDCPFVAIGRLLVLEPKETLNGFFVSELINQTLDFAIEKTGVPQLTAPQVTELKISVPDYKEQCKISEILSVMDEEIKLIIAYNRKIKKIKQGMMQELLTGRTRLV